MIGPFSPQECPSATGSSPPPTPKHPLYPAPLIVHHHTSSTVDPSINRSPINRPSNNSRRSSLIQRQSPSHSPYAADVSWSRASPGQAVQILHPSLSRSNVIAFSRAPPFSPSSSSPVSAVNARGLNSSPSNKAFFPCSPRSPRSPSIGLTSVSLNHLNYYNNDNTSDNNYGNNNYSINNNNDNSPYDHSPMSQECGNRLVDLWKVVEGGNVNRCDRGRVIRCGRRFEGGGREGGEGGGGGGGGVGGRVGGGGGGMRNNGSMVNTFISLTGKSPSKQHSPITMIRV